MIFCFIINIHGKHSLTLEEGFRKTTMLKALIQIFQPEGELVGTRLESVHTTLGFTEPAVLITRSEAQ